MGANNSDNFIFKTEEKFSNQIEDYMSDIVPKEQQERARELANNHVDWLLDIMRPLLIAEFIHGFRHGWELNEDNKNETSL